MKKKKFIKHLKTQLACRDNIIQGLIKALPADEVKFNLDELPDLPETKIQPHFDEVTEENTNPIQVGKWYKATEPANCLWYVEEISLEGEPTLKGYGFLDGTWRDSKEVSYSGNNVKWMKNRLVPATDTEVFEALKAEAERRGFKEGNFTPVRSSHEAGFTGWSYLSGINTLFSAPLGKGGCVVFEKGKWATIIDQPAAIDWSKAGQLVKSDKVIVITSGESHNDTFTGSPVSGKIDYNQRYFSKVGFTLCTEPITLKNE